MNLSGSGGDSGGDRPWWTGRRAAPAGESLATGAPLSLSFATLPGVWRKAQTKGTLGGFARSWWAPVYRAQLLLAEFARLEWRDLDVKMPDSDRDQVRTEIADLIVMRDLRRDHLPEIQAQAEGFTDVFHELLDSGNGRRPATATLVHAGIQIGAMTVMHYKAKFNRARPVHVYPALMPVIPTPPHPAFPSGHATQAHLVRHLVVMAVGPDLQAAFDPPLSALAARIAKNREIAGVHFPSDSAGGEALAAGLAAVLGSQLDTMPAFKACMEAAQAEWSDLEKSGLPEGLPKQAGGDAKRP